MIFYVTLKSLSEIQWRESADKIFKTYQELVNSSEKTELQLKISIQLYDHK